MKKFLWSIFLLSMFMVPQNVFAIEDIVSLDEIETSKPEQMQIIPKVQVVDVKFDWLELSLAQREENIDHFKNLLFEENQSKIYYSKDEFKRTFAEYKKDRNFKHHYMLTNNGVIEDEEAKYCAFYYKKNTLMMYAIQYKKEPQKAFYYTAFGKLYYTDLMSEEYPQFPYTSMQYNRKGQLKSAIYFVSRDIQYIFGPEKEFRGVWYKDKFYDKNGNQISSRAAW